MKVTTAFGFMIFLPADIYYHKSCYIKWTINPIRKSDKNPNKNENKSKYSTL